MIRKSNQRQGFTLVELLMVVVILGVLGGIAMPRFFPQKEKAVVAEAIGILSAIRMGEMAYRLETGNYLAIGFPGGAADWRKIGLDNPNTSPSGVVNFQYRVEFTVADNYAEAKRANSGDSAYDGKTIRIGLENGTWFGDHPFKPS